MNNEEFSLSWKWRNGCYDTEPFRMWTDDEILEFNPDCWKVTDGTRTMYSEFRPLQWEKDRFALKPFIPKLPTCFRKEPKLLSEITEGMTPMKIELTKAVNRIISDENERIALARRKYAISVFAPSNSQKTGLDKETVKAKCDMLALYLSLGGTEPRYMRGTKIAVKCILHGEDRRPSARLDLERKTFRCYTCNEYHDAFGLVMAVDGCDFPTAIGKCNDI